MIEAEQVLNFWFQELSPKQWWLKDSELDKTIEQRFLNSLLQAQRCELFSWRTSARGRLAEVIVLDQFSRNIFREQAAAFTYDPLALALAQEAIAQGDDQKLKAIERSFLYLPFMHSESASIHVKALELYTANNIDDNLEFELKHKAIIDRFGRYPHRNSLLGRVSTTEEIDFLKKPGSSF